MFPDGKEGKFLLFYLFLFVLLWGWGAHGLEELVCIEDVSTSSQVTPEKSRLLPHSIGTIFSTSRKITRNAFQ